LNQKTEEIMLHEVEGDILMTQAQAIAHGVAPNDHFDTGLALQLRDRWPAMAKDFRHYAHQTHPRAGEIFAWAGAGGTRIFNLMTQDGDHGHGARPGKATLQNVNHCLRRLRHEIEKEGIKSLAIPALATGVGGLAWKDVRPLLVEAFGDLQIPVYVYGTYRKGVAAKEPAK
jgi:O-acetyl-ADP-ribose deacetylase (regulator of RNase III)